MWPSDANTPSVLVLLGYCMQLGSDKDWSLVFAVFDENKSWYVKENIRNQTLTGCNDSDANVYDANVIYSKFPSPTTSEELVKRIRAAVKMSRRNRKIVYSHLDHTVTNLVKGRDL